MNIFEKNLSLYTRRNLSGISPSFAPPEERKWRPIIQEGLYTNLQKGTSKLYPSDPERFIDSWLSSLALEETDTLVIYGMELGKSYQWLKTSWLNEGDERAIIYIEDDHEVLDHFLRTSYAHEILLDPKVFFIFTGDETNLKPIIHSCAALFSCTRVQVTTFPHYRCHKTEKHREINKALMLNNLLYARTNREMIFHYQSPTANIYSNISNFPGAFQISSPSPFFRGVPAIICGAGPSLKEQLPLLETLKDRALFFAGGSAINALSNNHIIPHFGGTVDPNPEQLHRMRNHAGFMVPLLFSTRTHKQSLSQFGGELLYLPLPNADYGINNWLHEKFGIQTIQSPEAISIPQVLMHMARLLGCDPIILVGIDHAYTEGKNYVEGIEEQTIAKQGTLQETSIQGKTISTRWEWLTESSLFADYIAKYPDTTFINATAEGLPMRDVSHQPLPEVVEQFLKREYDTQGLVHQWIHTELKPPLAKEDISAFFKEVKEHLKEATPILRQGAEQIRSIQRIVESGGKTLPVQSIKQVTSSKERLQTNPAYTHILEPASYAHHVQLSRRFALTEDWSENPSFDREVLKKRFYLAAEEMGFLYQVAQTHCSILDQFISKMDSETTHK